MDNSIIFQSVNLMVEKKSTTKVVHSTSAAKIRAKRKDDISEKDEFHLP